MQGDGAQAEPDELPELRRQRPQSSEAELKAMRQITEEEVTTQRKSTRNLHGGLNIKKWVAKDEVREVGRSQVMKLLSSHSSGPHWFFSELPILSSLFNGIVLHILMCLKRSLLFQALS